MNSVFVAALLCSIGVAVAAPSGAILAAPTAWGTAVAPGLLGGWAPGIWGAAGAITPGGGTIAVSGHGAAVRGPPTAPAVISGPSGTVAADGLWGPTAAWGHGAWGHGW